MSFMAHAVWGVKAHNETAIEHGGNALSVWQYFKTSQFWFESFQNWQSEFLAIFAIVGLSIWLREQGSPESKPVAAAHSETGR
jgi:antibiotic biosynthesis monooxygenase (ABM) superfamily enzyme